MIRLLDYQVTYLNNMPKNIIMAAETGLGKTFMALEHYRRHNAGGRLLIVAPASKVRTKDWGKSAFDYLAKGYAVDEPQPLQMLPEFEVVSYEGMSKRWNEFVDPNLTIIADECHFLCNATSKRSKAFLKIAKAAKQWILLSATALPNGWKSAETYAILTGLSRNKTDFVQRFELIDRSKGFPILLGYREKDVLADWWGRVSKPLPRTGDLILPSTNIPVHITMKPKLRAVYRKAFKDRVYEEELLDSPSKVFATLRQIPAVVRVEALQSVIEGTDEHLIVFYNFNNERDAILAMLEKSFKGRKIYEQSGHTSNLPNRARWTELKPSVTLVQYQSGSQAIELTYASITVYLSPPTSYSNYEQSRGRNLRHGQEKVVLFYHIAVEESLDYKIWQIIKNKQVFSDKIMQNIIDNK